jgi:hypothetical protein
MTFFVSGTKLKSLYNHQIDSFSSTQKHVVQSTFSRQVISCPSDERLRLTNLGVENLGQTQTRNRGTRQLGI